MQEPTAAAAGGSHVAAPVRESPAAAAAALAAGTAAPKRTAAARGLSFAAAAAAVSASESCWLPWLATEVVELSNRNFPWVPRTLREVREVRGASVAVGISSPCIRIQLLLVLQQQRWPVADEGGSSMSASCDRMASTSQLSAAPAAAAALL